MTVALDKRRFGPGHSSRVPRPENDLDIGLVVSDAVTCDDSRTDEKGLTAATTNARYPSVHKGCTHASSIGQLLSPLRHGENGEDANQRMPVLLRMHQLR